MAGEVLKAEQCLLFEDLVLLAIIERQEDPTPPTRVELITEHSMFFCDNKISEALGTPIRNSYTFQLHIKKLRRFGLVESKGSFILTESGQKFMDELRYTHSSWDEWPIVLPFDGTFHWSEAFYLKELI